MTTCIQCNNQALQDSDFCANCENKEFKKIRGWLFVPAFGLLIGIIANIVALTNTLKIALNNYDVLQAALKGILFFELFSFIGLFLLSVYTTSLFFRKKRQLPRSYIGLLLANILFLAIDLYLGNRYLDVALNYEESRSLIRSIIGACIWIPYFCVSVRVKRTFVH
ncbi:DUF2569 domain-containing protein [Serratia proteamaculans]|uniref:DUF2569 domain-containing protein n=1 Tax=Serratia proteamaculans TaxID=28151 RepID=UPI00217C8562|nr:DUF2569 domain-containing protein [Serratia proteamaculans]CAI1829184.1 Protein of uncharacterised function (DUF2569) [Serratia proteamaculans]